MSNIGFNRYVEGLNIQHRWGTEVMFEVFIRQSGIPVLEAIPYVTVWRHSDGYVLDNLTNTFVEAAYPYNYEMLIPMQEFGDGLYQYFFNQALYVDPTTIETGTYQGIPLNEAYTLIYRVSYRRNGRVYDGSDMELHLFGTGIDRELRVLYDQHRRLLHKHRQFDPTNIRDYRFCEV